MGLFPANLSKMNQLPANQLQWDHSVIKESSWGQGGQKQDRHVKKRLRESSPDRDDINDTAENKTKSAYDFSELCDEVYNHPEVGYGYGPEGEIILKSAVGVVSSRDGVHSNNPVDGKPAYSVFRMIGYSAVDNTSLVECQPLTGRTHQLRLHLQLLGNPIANDPCYGGDTKI